MLGKLFKYDFKRGAQILLTIIISLIIFLIFSLFITSFNNNIANSLIIFIGIISSIGFFATYAIVHILNFYNTMTKNESYFTHSIPASMNKIVFSKILSAFIWGIICILTIVFFWMILINALDVKIQSDEILKQLLRFMIIMILCQFVFTIALMAFSICLSVYTRFKNKNYGITISIISYIVLSYACGILQVGVIAMVLSIQGKLMRMFSNDITDNEVLSMINSFMPSAVIIYLAFAVLFYYFTVRIFTRHKSI